MAAAKACLMVWLCSYFYIVSYFIGLLYSFTAHRGGVLFLSADGASALWHLQILDEVKKKKVEVEVKSVLTDSVPRGRKPHLKLTWHLE